MKLGTLVTYKHNTHPFTTERAKRYGVGIVVRVVRHLNTMHRVYVRWSHGRVLNHPITFLVQVKKCP